MQQESYRLNFAADIRSPDSAGQRDDLAITAGGVRFDVTGFGDLRQF